MHAHQLAIVACWSRGMIPALGAGGPGFKSRTGPILISTNKNTLTKPSTANHKIGRS